MNLVNRQETHMEEYQFRYRWWAFTTAALLASCCHSSVSTHVTHEFFCDSTPHGTRSCSSCLVERFDSVSPKP